MTRYTTLRDANTARQKEWDPGNVIPLTYRTTELAGELGEACNVVKKLERERLGIRGSRDTLEHLAEELADVVICTDLIAMQVGIDLDEAVREKFNATSVKYKLDTRLHSDRRTAALREALAWIYNNTEPDAIKHRSYEELAAALSALAAQALDGEFHEDMHAAEMYDLNKRLP